MLPSTWLRITASSEELKSYSTTLSSAASAVGQSNHMVLVNISASTQCSVAPGLLTRIRPATKASPRKRHNFFASIHTPGWECTWKYDPIHSNLSIVSFYHTLVFLSRGNLQKRNFTVFPLFSLPHLKIKNPGHLQNNPAAICKAPNNRKSLENSHAATICWIEGFYPAPRPVRRTPILCSQTLTSQHKSDVSRYRPLLE